MLLTGSITSFMLKDIISKIIIGWLKACTDSPWIPPLVNGRNVGFFSASKGIRQVCRFSPFLYIIMAEVLGRYLDNGRIKDTLPSIKMVTGSVTPIFT